jgi:SAM-dependent methyltransferase
MTVPRETHQAEAANRRLWDELAPVHMAAYEEVRLLEDGEEVLDEIELAEVGDVRGKALLHLQCHIGTDSLAWRRHGAAVTGVDFSEASIRCAQALADRLGLDARFLHGSVYDVPDLLTETFDVVYTSKGVLCWLRDLRSWARIIEDRLKPGGIVYLMESHPTLNALEEIVPGELSIAHRYFHTERPTRWGDAKGDYADPSYVPKHPSFEWEWAVSDILGALLEAGLRVELCREYERLFFQRFPSMTGCRPRWYHFPRYAGKLPLLLTVRARKPEAGA